MTICFIISGYVAVSVALYFICKQKCKTNPVFTMPRSRILYYILSFTWGLPMNFIGCLVAMALRICGNKPVKYGWDWCFEFQGLNWGLELGIFFIAPKGNYTHTKNHEHGHGIQNIYLGFFTPAVVSIPSVTRFWYREFRYSVLKKRNLTDYSAVWFEGSADKSGEAFMERFNGKEICK